MKNKINVCGALIVGSLFHHPPLPANTTAWTRTSAQVKARLKARVSLTEYNRDINIREEWRIGMHAPHTHISYRSGTGEHPSMFQYFFFFYTIRMEKYLVHGDIL